MSVLPMKKILGIVAAVALTGAALWYNNHKKNTFVLEDKYIPAAGSSLNYYSPSRYYYHKGKRKKRRESCKYILCSYKNRAGSEVKSHCVYDYVKDSICEKAKECTEQASCD